MRIPETENCYGMVVSVRAGLVSPELVVKVPDGRFALCLDQEQAALLIPVLQHFVETGGLPCTTG